jgi:biopolymer transport protein ExbB
MYSILLSAGWPIWPLLIISIIGLAIIIERAWYLRQIHIFPKDSLEQVFGVANAISKQKVVSAAEIGALSQLSPVTPLFCCALSEKAAGSSADNALEELQARAQTTWLKLDRYLGALATIATVAPLLGRAIDSRGHAVDVGRLVKGGERCPGRNRRMGVPVDQDQGPGAGMVGEGVEGDAAGGVDDPVADLVHGQGNGPVRGGQTGGDEGGSDTEQIAAGGVQRGFVHP